MHCPFKQVDIILISKNQVLQILHLKLHLKLLLFNSYTNNTPHNWPAFLGAFCLILDRIRN